MTEAEPQHEEIIARSLASLNRDPAELRGYELLGGGISGAYTYRVHLATGQVILKVTLPGSAPYVLQRAEREAMFYLELADRVPLSTPQVVGIRNDEASGVSILLASYRSSPPADKWSRDEYIEAARQLGRYHATFWGKAEQLSAYGWLNRREDGITAQEVRAAYDQWQRLGVEGQFEPLFTPQLNRRIMEALQHANEAQAIVRSLPLTLCHGDCHAGNVLLDSSGRFVWADWQEVGLGRGPEDLSFFLQRACFDAAAVPGASWRAVPREEMTRAYWESLVGSADLPTPISYIDVDNALQASELLSLLMAWPGYLPFASTSQMAYVLYRIEEILSVLEAQGFRSTGLR